MLLEIFTDSVADSVRLVPFLFLTYLMMEWLEHKTGGGIQKIVTKAGRFGPFAGAALGIFPQCGFSAAASSLYAGRMITLGTLFSIYLSTSDEMLPILISEAAPVSLIGTVLAIKAITGMTVGFVLDMFIRKTGRTEEIRIGKLCGQSHCHCDKGIFLPALRHTAQIFFFVFLVNLMLNGIIAGIGRDALAVFLLDRGIWGELVAGLVGMIPNCAASVILTELYLEGTMGFGALLAGLLTGSGIGLLVLFRVNRNKIQNMQIAGLLYVTGVVAGIGWNLLAGYR